MINAATMSNADLDRKVIELDSDLYKQRKALRYPLQTIKELSAKPVAKKYIIKPIIAAGETSSWISPPGGMKSSLVGEMLICAAANRDWHGMRSKTGECGVNVVYFALERADLIRRRMIAQCAQMGIAGQEFDQLPISICSSLIDLTNAQGVKDVIRTLEVARDLHGGDPSVAAFDTWAKLIAAGGGDEDKAKDQGKVFANIKLLKERFPGLHVALVGHTGKDVDRGARGSSAHPGDVDALMTISGDSIKTVNVIKANDLPEGPLFSFKGKVHEFGVDEDGDPITVNIISDEDVSSQVATKLEAKARPKPEHKIALDAFDEVVCHVPPPVLGLPASIKVASVEDWKLELRRRGVLDPSHSNPPQQFKRLWETMVALNMIGRRDDWVWRA